MEPPRAEERALVERCIEGDADAWTEIVQRYGHGVSARVSQVYLRRLGRNANPHEAQEVAQEVFVRLARDRARSLRNFAWRCSLATYLSAVAGTCALDRIRQEARASARMGPRADFEIASEEAAVESDPAGKMALGESREALYEALAALSERDRLVVRMYYWERVPPARIAKALGTSPDYVWTILKRTIERLKKEIR